MTVETGTLSKKAVVCGQPVRRCQHTERSNGEASRPHLNPLAHFSFRPRPILSAAAISSGTEVTVSFSTGLAEICRCSSWDGCRNVTLATGFEAGTVWTGARPPCLFLLSPCPFSFNPTPQRKTGPFPQGKTGPSPCGLCSHKNGALLCADCLGFFLCADSQPVPRPGPCRKSCLPRLFWTRGRGYCS